MLNELCQNQHTFQFMLIAFVVDKVAEYWLGKTDKVQAGSMIELLFNGLKALMKKKE